MLILSRTRQQLAEQFIVKSARPFEKQLYMHYFSGEEIHGPLRELAAYQNPDGGFGNGLEPDIRASCSSAYVTGEALRTLRELQVPDSHPLVKGAVRYLFDSYDEETGVWQVATPEANESPHAPWMGSGEEVERQWHGFLANPRAAIVGSLLHYASLVPEEWLSQVLDSLTTYLVSRGNALDGYESGAVGQLLDAEALPREIFDRLVASVGEKIGLPTRPDSPLMGQFTSEEVEQDLDSLVESQCPDGTWPVTWSWGGADSDVWATAENEWKGILIVAQMRKLKAFGRLE